MLYAKDVCRTVSVHSKFLNFEHCSQINYVGYQEYLSEYWE